MKKNRVTTRTKNLGYTLPEVLAVVLIIGVLSTITGPMKAWYENSLGNGTSQTVGLFNKDSIIIRFKKNKSGFKLYGEFSLYEYFDNHFIRNVPHVCFTKTTKY